MRADNVPLLLGVVGNDVTNKDLGIIKAYLAYLARNMDLVGGVGTCLVTSTTIFKIWMFFRLAGVALLEVVDLLEVVSELTPLLVVEGADVALVLKLEMDLLEVSFEVFFPLQFLWTYIAAVLYRVYFVHLRFMSLQFPPFGELL